jgi:hypothetical protein
MPRVKQIIRIVELFSGTHSWVKPWIEHFQDDPDVELRIYSIDNQEQFAHDTTHIGDILLVGADEILEYLGGRPDYLFASPPCTTFSVASIGTHWGGGRRAYIPKTDAARLGLELVEHTQELIDDLEPTFYWIENPRGVLRKLPIMNDDARVELENVVIWYCTYGTTMGMKRAKPTDLWGKWPSSWIPRPVCRNGNPNCDHVRAPRGAKTGTQGLSGNMARSMIPKELCREIMIACLVDRYGWNQRSLAERLVLMHQEGWI